MKRNVANFRRSLLEIRAWIKLLYGCIQCKNEKEKMGRDYTAQLVNRRAMWDFRTPYFWFSVSSCPTRISRIFSQQYIFAPNSNTIAEFGLIAESFAKIIEAWVTIFYISSKGTEQTESDLFWLKSDSIIAHNCPVVQRERAFDLWAAVPVWTRSTASCAVYSARRRLHTRM